MGRRKIDLVKEKELADCIRHYKCLYDKSQPQYKDKRAKANAWKKVEETMGMDPIHLFISYHE